MNSKNNIRFGGIVCCVALLAGCAPARANGSGDVTSKTSASQVKTNENGRISRTFSESSITTNGNLVTEHRRETCTDMDNKGNVLATTTSEYAQSYNVGDTPGQFPDPANAADPDRKAPAAKTDAFLGLTFGTPFAATNFQAAADEPTLRYATFTPKRPLDGFDTYYVYVTPKTHKIAKIYACAKEAVEPSYNWRRHYLIEALEKRYQTWARLCSFRRPYYAFDIAPDRLVTVCLTGASSAYETVIMACDEKVCALGVEEEEALRNEARKAAAERRGRRVQAAADAF